MYDFPIPVPIPKNEWLGFIVNGRNRLKHPHGSQSKSLGDDCSIAMSA